MPNKPKKKSSSKAITVAILSLIIFLAIIPLPFKPSLWVLIQEQKLSQEIDKSSEPVYLPTSGDRDHSVFETFLDWRNAYLIRFGDRATGEVVAYWQFSDTSVYSASSGGPSKEDLAPLRRVLKDEGCVAEGNDLWVCQLSDGRQFLMRKIGKVRLIAALTEARPDAKGTDLYRMGSAKDISATRRVMSNAEPVSLQEANPKYFEPSF
ncbi:MAG TPA: hypothetical protein VMR98_02560 [Candidatus Polarisedimenticolaceae bacterium]|nr:hypothetical protein [Candidatus Polarisedimenticolaceae bacterium]